MPPRFLAVDDVLSIHRHLINKYGGSHGVRDMGLLESAIAQPSATFGGEFLHGDIFEMAGAYLFHIVKNHPFIDGNKRAGATAALVFLFTNGIQIQMDQMAFADFVLEVAESKRPKASIAPFLRAHAISA